MRERTDDLYEIRRNAIMEIKIVLFLMKTLIIFASSKFVSLFLGSCLAFDIIILLSWNGYRRVLIERVCRSF